MAFEKGSNATRIGFGWKTNGMKTKKPFTEPPPDMDVNDPRWPEAFTAWMERKARHFNMDAIELMGRALGLNSEADDWRKRQQERLRRMKHFGGDVHGNAT